MKAQHLNNSWLPLKKKGSAVLSDKYCKEIATIFNGMHLAIQVLIKIILMIEN